MNERNRLLIWIALATLWGALAMGCRPKIPLAPGTGAGSRLSLQIRTRSCPNELAFSPDTTAQSRFQGAPCKLSDALSACVKRCVPFGGPGEINDALDGFLDRCGDANVLCVGAGQETQSLADAAKRVAADPSIDRILLAKGRYQGGIAFALKGRGLTIEGASNDPTEGAVIEAPEWAQGTLPADAAAMSFQGATKLVLRRFAVTGGRHGIVVGGVSQVIVDGVSALQNVGHGLRLGQVKEAQISRSLFSANGMPQDGQIKGASSCRYGVVLADVDVATIESSHFVRNGAGGLRAGPGDMVDETAACARLRIDPGVQRTTSNDRALTLNSNLFEENGPVGWQSTPGRETCEAISCQDGWSCEGGRCVPPLRKGDAPGEVSVVGVGAAIAGFGRVTLIGNGFHRNDTMGLSVHAALQVQLQENAISLNGLRKVATAEGLTQAAVTAARMWKVVKLTAIHNLITDNAATGLALVADQRQTSAELIANHFSGNGRFATQRTDSGGSGLQVTSAQEGSGAVFSIDDNYFSANARAGSWMSGAMQLDMTGNYLEYQLGMGAVFVDMGQDPRSTLSLTSNTIKGARGVGVRFRGGAARVLLDANLIKEIRPVKDSPDGAATDGLQLISLTGEPAVLTGNKFDGQWQDDNETPPLQGRAGVLLHGSRATLKDNGFAAVTHPIVIQSEATLLSATETKLHRPATPLSIDGP